MKKLFADEEGLTASQTVGEELVFSDEIPESFSVGLTLNDTYTSTVTAKENVLVKNGTVIRSGYPAGIQLTSGGKTVTLENAQIFCSSIRNGAILFGDDASWGGYLDGTVTFTGSKVLLDSRTSNCIDAAGIVGKNLTVNFTGDADNSGGIRFVSTQGTGPANYASAVKAEGNLTVNGTFGGEIRSFFDCSLLTETRWAHVYGFQAAGDLLINNDIAGVIALSAYTKDSNGSYAFGLYAGESLTVKGEISGTIVALAETRAFGLYGYENLDVTISGTIFTGFSAEGKGTDSLLSLLADPEKNKNTLSEYIGDGSTYSVYSTGKSDVALTAGALLWGDVYLSCGSDFTISSAATVYGDVTLYGQSEKCSIEFVLEDRRNTPVIGGQLYDYRWGYSKFVIDAEKALNGQYILAENFTSYSQTVTIEAGGQYYDFVLRGNKTSYTFRNGMTVEVDNTASKLIVNVSGSSNVFVDKTAPVLSGTPSALVRDNTVTISWNVAGDNVKVAGYEFRYGLSAVPEGAGITVIGNSLQLEDLENGEYSFQIRAYDAAGNYSDWSSVQTFTVDYTPPVYLPYEVPRAEYMYGCTATVVGMLLGYYDKYGYSGYDVSDLIADEVEVNARGLDNNKYDMDAFDTVLGRAIASEGYVQRFYNQSASVEYGYTFKNSVPELNIEAWDCIADFLGTGQYWRGNGDLSTSYYYATLSTVKEYTFTRTREQSGISAAVPGKFEDLLYGLDLYVSQAGYELDADATMTVKTSNNDDGTFDFEDYKAEIDAGRAVIIHIFNHSMLGYGYDEVTNEIIFDDTYEHGQRMTWGGSYYYSGADRKMHAVTVVVFDTGDLEKLPPLKAPVVSADTREWTTGPVLLTALFDTKSVLDQYSFDQKNWFTYSAPVSVEYSRSVYFRSRNGEGEYSSVTEYEVLNIDLTGPQITVTGHENWSAADIVLHGVLTDEESGPGSLMFSLNNKDWRVCTEAGVRISQNGVVYFKGYDALSNETVTSVEISCIDRESPELEILGNPTAWCRGTVTLTAVVSDEMSGVKKILYSFDREEWQDYSEQGVDVDRNGIVYFKALDQVDNEIVKSVEISTLDNDAPVLTLAADTYAPAGMVTVTCSPQDQISGVVLVEYSFDEINWLAGMSVTVTENKAVFFRGADAAGNVSDTVVFNVTNIDKTAPEKPVVSANTMAPTNQDVILTADFAPDVAVREYSFDNENWMIYSSSIVATVNGTYYFRCRDAAGNVSEVTEYQVANIDRVAPVKPVVTADIVTLTNEDVTLTAEFSEDSAVKQYSSDGEIWKEYSGEVVAEQNGVLYFRGIDAAGNISQVTEHYVGNVDKEAPDVPSAVTADVDNETAFLDWAEGDDPGVAGMKGFRFRWGESEALTGEGEFVTDSEKVLTELALGRYYFQVQAADQAGNLSEWSDVYSFDVSQIKNVQCSAGSVSWNNTSDSRECLISFVQKDETLSLSIQLAENKIDLYFLDAGEYQCLIRPVDDELTAGKKFQVENSSPRPQVISAESNEVSDLFSVRVAGAWKEGYKAQHQGFKGWKGTAEEVELAGKNRIADIFKGSDDANLLILTDSDNGDALFFEDIFSLLPSNCYVPGARLTQINGIWAGAGDDIVDMTGQLFSWKGSGIKICGGAGNDTIWANSGSNLLFGDSGNDRLIGGGDDDLICGGSGNDRMHGGGGDDIFTFCAGWGQDEIEQLDGGTVTLWFENGSLEQWDRATRTYSDGTNFVHVSGSCTVELRFGNCDALNVSGAFDPWTEEYSFEEEGILA